MNKLRLFLCSALFCLLMSTALSAPAMDWMSVNQSTVAWDAVTSLEGGGTIPANDRLFYRVYTKAPGSSEQTMVGETDVPQFTVTFTQEGRYLVGVQAVRVPEGQTTEQVSNIIWSDLEDTNYVPNPFGIVYYLNPLSPSGFTPK